MDFINYLIIALLLAIILSAWFKSAILSQVDIGMDTTSRERKLARRADELRGVISDNYAYAETLRAAATRIETANAITIATVASAAPETPLTEEEFQQLVKREAEVVKA